MWEAILALLLGKTILLTPAPILVPVGGHGVSMELAEPIIALTAGANIQIDVSAMAVELGVKGDFRRSRRWVDDKFPVDSVEVTLEGNETKPVRFVFRGASATRDGLVRLILTGENLKTDVEYQRLTVRTKVPLDEVSIFWRNYAH